VLHWHGDRCRLSKSAELLASSLHCPEQAFRMGEHAVGLQFHLETTPHCIKRWVEEDHDFINGAGVNQQTILSDLEQFRLTADQQATVLLNQLLDHLLAQA
jgi:GMP synthase (glutamine-hydrolysing)